MPDRPDISLSPPEVDEMLQHGHTMVLVSLASDGAPHPVPMWYLRLDGQIWLRTYAKSQKAHNLARDPRFAALLEDGERYSELRGVQLSGVVSLYHDLDRIVEIATALAVKYEGLEPDHEEAFGSAYGPHAASKQVAIRLDVAHTASWDHAKVSTT